MNKILATLAILVLIVGCAPRPASKALSPSEAHQKLTSILKEENDLTVITKEFDNALWIYLPFEENFLEMKAKPQGAAPTSTIPSESVTIHFLEGSFTDRGFKITYDISPSKKYAKDPGYASTFSEKYQTDQRNILTAISRAYSDQKEASEENQLFGKAPENMDAPNIFILVLTDIVNGLESRIFLHLKDLKRAYNDQTFYEEYAKRVISQQPFGDPAAINDKTGEHINFHNVTLPEFLAKQMIFRTEFKYTRSAFLPAGTPTEEILKAAVETIDAYDFEEFASIELQDLNSGTTHSYPKENLDEYRAKSSEAEGRLIHIRFQ